MILPITAAIKPELVFLQLLDGFGFTVKLFFLTLLFSLPLGLIVAFCRMSNITPFKVLARLGFGKNKVSKFIVEFNPLRAITKLYISIMRGTPLMLQLMVVFYGPSYLFENINFDRFTAAVIAFSINYAAYFAEIYRGGIESIPKGQYEAAQVLGFSKAQTFVRIVLPQVLKNVLPSVTNEVITLVKDTSLASVISYAEMFTAAKRLAAKHVSLLPYVGAGLFYYIANYIVAFIMERFEKKMNYYEK